MRMNKRGKYMWFNVLNVVCGLNKTDDISMRLNNKKKKKETNLKLYNCVET